MELSKEMLEMEARNEALAMPAHMAKKKLARVEPIAAPIIKTAVEPEYTALELSERQQKYEDEKGNELVRGIFYDNEIKGGKCEMVTRFRKGQPIRKWPFTDRGVYSITRDMYRHLRDACYYPVHAYSLDENGVAQIVEGQKIRRYGFQLFDQDEEDILVDTPNLLTSRTY